MNDLLMALETEYTYGGLTPSSVEGISYFFRTYGVEITPTYTLPIGATPSQWTLQYIVTDPNNNVNTYPEITCDLSSQTIQFTLSTLGIYSINCVITNTNTGDTYTEILQIGCQNFLTAIVSECGTFVITNNSTVDIVITIDDIEDAEILQDTTIDVGNSYTFTTTDPLLYFLTATYTPPGGIETEEVYVLNNYCHVNDCLSSYILDVVCEDTRLCKDCPSETDLNQLLLLIYTYTMKLNKEYGISNFYTNLTQAQLDEFTTIQTVMDRLVKFCARRECAGVSNSNPGYSWSNSGCTSCN